MTALLVDQFKGETFVFSDGIAMTGDLVTIVSTNCEKSVYNKDKSKISAGCGDIAVIQEVNGLVDADTEVSSELLKTKGSATVLVADIDKLTTLYINYDDRRDKLDVAKNFYILKDGAHFHGSGGPFLRAAWFALEPRKSKTKKEYLDKIRKCFKVGTKCTGTITELKHVKTISRGK